jgi:hypothetical protein
MQVIQGHVPPGARVSRPLAEREIEKVDTPPQPATAPAVVLGRTGRLLLVAG